MPIDNEQQTQTAIDTWRAEPPRAQLRLIAEASDSLEMSLMYYEEKGSVPGMARAARCLALLKARRAEIEATTTIGS